MAQKRMFDKAVLDTDKFMDLPSSTKAFYFLLGIEADDEGFVSHKKVARTYNFADDEIKILISKQFVIPFQSGVVVITDWHKHNYLNQTRIRPTEYQDEKKSLLLTDDKKYVFNNGLTPVKQMFNQYSIEQSSIDENNNNHQQVDEIIIKKPKRQKKEKPLVVEYSDQFKKFYNLYPRHIGKYPSWQKWEKIVKEIDPNVIIDALQKQIDNQHFSDKMEFIPHPEFWLSKRRWEDEIIKKEIKESKTKSY